MAKRSSSIISSHPSLCSSGTSKRPRLSLNLATLSSPTSRVPVGSNIQPATVHNFLSDSSFPIKAVSYHKGRNSSWKIPSSPTSKILVLGDSNISRITRSPISIHKLSLVSYPGGRFRHLLSALNSSQSQHTLPNPHPKVIILSLGLSHISDSLSSLTLSVQRTIDAFHSAFPGTLLFLPLLNFNPLLPLPHRTLLQQFNSYLSSNFPDMVLPQLQQSQFHTNETDLIHWLPPTANAILSHWLNNVPNLNSLLFQTDPTSSVLNLSSSPLNSAQNDLLSLGLNFIRSPNQIHSSELTDSLFSFTRRLKLIYQFRNSKRTPLPFLPPSTYTPHPSLFPPSLLSIFSEFSDITNHTPIISEFSNLPPHLCTALRTLSSQDFFIIKPADKGSCVVIQDRSNYIREGIRQLSVARHYSLLPGPLHLTTIPKVNRILQSLKKEKFLSSKQLQYLSPPPEPRPRIFYTLPKIHKDPATWAVR